MLNWEYDADAEKRVLKQEAEQEGLQRGLQRGHQQGLQEGLQQGAALTVKLLQEGMSYEDALKQITEQSSGTPAQ